MNLFDALNPSAYRYERKFYITHLALLELEHLIHHHPALFSEIFYERQVNNIYFDSVALRSYFDNLAGISQRYKARIRWYGDTFGIARTPTLEIKLKNNALGQKLRYNLPDLPIGPHLSHFDWQRAIIAAGVPAHLRDDLLGLRPVFANSYRRKYFQSADRRFRLTIDRDLKYYRVSSAWGVSPVAHQLGSGLVMELKYSPEADELADRITAWFPFRVTKNSKYIHGVETLYA